MTRFHPLARLLLCLALATAAPLVAAHEGEDHGAPAAPVAVAPVTTDGPRASVATATFEVVAVLQPGQLLFYVDRYDTNGPVTGATVDVEGAGVSGRAKEIAPGVYALGLALPVPGLAPGVHALTLTVEAADTADLLALSLVVPDAEVAASPTGKATGGVIAAAVVLLLSGGAAWWRYAARRREAAA